MTEQAPAPAEPATCVEVAALIEAAGSVLNEHFGEIVVSGTISGYRHGRRFSYARLVAYDPKTSQPNARLPVVFDHRVNGHSADLNGSHVAVTGRVTPHALYGPFQLYANTVQVIYAESATTRATRDLRQAIINERLDQTNKQLSLRYDASKLVVICPIGGGAGGADVLHRLRSGPHHWDVSAVEVAMGGPNAAAQIATAITRHGGREIDGLLVCRGGGAASDMAAFDSPEVAKAIVQAHVPVIVAVGHATDSHIADLVAHTSLPTPSAAADWLNQKRDTAVDQARTLVTKAAEAAALAQQSKATAAQLSAAHAEAKAKSRERHARLVIAAAIILTAVFVAVLLT